MRPALLTTTHLTIQEIMYRVGISNKSYFYREFQKKYGSNPRNTVRSSSLHRERKSILIRIKEVVIYLVRIRILFLSAMHPFPRGCLLNLYKPQTEPTDFP